MFASFRLATKNLQNKVWQSALWAITPIISASPLNGNRQSLLEERITGGNDKFCTRDTATCANNLATAAATAAAATLMSNSAAMRHCNVAADINAYDDDMMYEERLNKLEKRRVFCDGNLSAVAPITQPPLPPPLPAIVDVDGYTDNMMYEDSPLVLELPKGIDNFTVPVAEDAEKQPKSDVASSTPKKSALDNICIAPVDIIDPWEDDLEAKQGTVDIDAYEEFQPAELPPIPPQRKNVYEFKGIKVILPKRMLRNETYRYCLDPNDKYRPDDIRVCTYDK